MSLPSSLIFLLQLPPSSRKMDNVALRLYTCPAVLVQRDRRMDRHDFSAVSPLSTVNTHYSFRHLHLGSSDAMSSSWRAGSKTRKRNEMKQTHCLGSWRHLLNAILFGTDWLLVNRQAAVDKMSTRGLVIRDREIVLGDILTKHTSCHHSMAVHQRGCQGKCLLTLILRCQPWSQGLTG